MSIWGVREGVWNGECEGKKRSTIKIPNLRGSKSHYAKR